MIEIIATAAVSGLLTGTAIGFSLARPWQDWTIKRDIERDLVRNRLRKSNEELRLEIATLQHNAAVDQDVIEHLKDEMRELDQENVASMAEIANLRRDLERAGKPDQQRDPKTGRWLPKSAEQREAA